MIYSTGFLFNPRPNTTQSPQKDDLYKYQSDYSKVSGFSIHLSEAWKGGMSAPLLTDTGVFCTFFIIVVDLTLFRVYWEHSSATGSMFRTQVLINISCMMLRILLNISQNWQHVKGVFNNYDHKCSKNWVPQAQNQSSLFSQSDVYFLHIKLYCFSSFNQEWTICIVSSKHVDLKGLYHPPHALSFYIIKSNI